MIDNGSTIADIKWHKVFVVGYVLTIKVQRF